MQHGIQVKLKEYAMKKWISCLLSWIDHAETRELENYLAQSASPSDLERRMREWENRHQGFNYLP